MRREKSYGKWIFVCVFCLLSYNFYIFSRIFLFKRASKQIFIYSGKFQVCFPSQIHCAARCKRRNKLLFFMIFINEKKLSTWKYFYSSSSSTHPRLDEKLSPLLSSFLMCIKKTFFRQKGGNVLQPNWSRFSSWRPEKLYNNKQTLWASKYKIGVDRELIF